MKKVRIIFLLASFVFFALALVFFNNGFFAGSSGVQLAENAPFIITDISGSGRVWQDEDETNPLNIRSIPTGEILLKADLLTSFEFIFRGIQFTALPGSIVHYISQTQELTLQAGEFYWQRLTGRDKCEVALGQPENASLLSDAGRLTLRNGRLVVWNYSAPLTLTYARHDYSLTALQMLQIDPSGEKRVTLLPAPSSIAPEAEQIELNTLNDAIVSFKWKTVPNSGEYRLRFYSSRLRENLLLTREVSGNSLALDILPYLTARELYWDVTVVNDRNGREAVPSKLGSIRARGSLLVSDRLPLPPQITIGALSVSGNMVLIRGTTDSSNQLFINDIPVKLDTEGRFIHTLTLKTIGMKDILFRVIAPSGMETVIKRQVTIFEEISEE